METWFLIIVTACLAALLRAFLSLKPKLKLPPGPPAAPIISGLQWLGKSSTEMEAALRRLYSKYGPIVRITIGSRSAIFISSRDLAHQALVLKGAIFADRPKQSPVTKLLNVSSSRYGPTWRILRRNLTSQILHPSQTKEYCDARKWALNILFTRLISAASTDPAVKVVDHIMFTLFCLLVLMCFGHKLEESKIQEIEHVERQLLLSFVRFRILGSWPRLTRILLRSRWEELFSLWKKQKELLAPLIRARKDAADDQTSKLVTCYVDTLLGLEIQDDQSNEKRKLTEEEMVTACSEFLDGGIETTATVMQWIMANLVKYPNIQAKLLDEIRGVVGAEAQVREEDLAKMPYLKAVVLEGLRRHPPGHFVLPHSVSQDVELGGYLVPKAAFVNFAVAEMNWDPKVWEDPMEFKPERFLSDNGSGGPAEFDITGSREIKMLTFGAGRRICPGYGLAIHHLEYFVANLVWKFEWTAAEGHEVDLTEKQEFTITMKHPLQARISPRQKLIPDYKMSVPEPLLWNP
ncbi:hypothetical protein Cgig2_033180 [Carnegiea gigantea]|uniref:Cytochrome P450 n=1 Tax=Carnegiea gigantea TaxID=171969 RepID=A0A9Q1Q725_9CARY|nr:hypothetical protein Cgig2_033180 [Carnegiea gigantea]